MHRFILAAVIAALPVAAAAATISPSTVVASPSTYDGQSITVTGTVSQYSTRSTAMGHFAGFQLCDTKCIVVIDKTATARTDGSSATVTGTFHVTFKAPHKTFTNALVI